MNTREFSGETYELDADGHLLKTGDWNKDLAAELGKDVGIEDLSDRHWAVIDFIRMDFKDTGIAPSMRRMTKESNVSIKELYQLFTKVPAKKSAYVAGLPKPKGCI